MDSKTEKLLLLLLLAIPVFIGPCAATKPDLKPIEDGLRGFPRRLGSYTSNGMFDLKADTDTKDGEQDTTIHGASKANSKAAKANVKVRVDAKSDKKIKGETESSTYAYYQRGYSSRWIEGSTSSKTKAIGPYATLYDQTYGQTVAGKKQTKGRQRSDIGVRGDHLAAAKSSVELEFGI